MSASDADIARVGELLGRRPRGAFDVVVRDVHGDPVVVRNEPFLDDGTPMPTRFYLVGTEIVPAVSRVESAGAVDEVEAELDSETIAAIHRRYEVERDAAIPDDHTGHRPSGGVGGTRIGVKCLHAHVAHELATGDDEIGKWTLARIPADTLGVPVASATASAADDGLSAGSLLVSLSDHEMAIDLIGGGSWTIPVGPASLVENELERADRPRPEQLTNALGIVIDHLDDIVRESPMVLDAVDVAVTGRHVDVVARVELGVDDVPTDYRLTRPDADEVFRTLVSEPIAERVHNPGLDEADVETVIGGLCCVLAVLRRFELTDIAVRPSGSATD